MIDFTISQLEGRAIRSVRKAASGNASKSFLGIRQLHLNAPASVAYGGPDGLVI